MPEMVRIVAPLRQIASPGAKADTRREDRGDK